MPCARPQAGRWTRPGSAFPSETRRRGHEDRAIRQDALLGAVRRRRRADRGDRLQERRRGSQAPVDRQGIARHTDRAAGRSCGPVFDDRRERAMFPLGRTLATPGALEALCTAGQSPQELLARHRAGDWGTVSEDDARANERALIDGERLLSAYVLRSGVKVWV